MFPSILIPPFYACGESKPDNFLCVVFVPRGSVTLPAGDMSRPYFNFILDSLDSLDPNRRFLGQLFQVKGGDISFEGYLIVQQIASNIH